MLATKAVAKTLSANDTGDTGGHQAGMLVPKDKKILDFFPPLDATTLNPRHRLVFHEASGERWEFAFIYYNNKLFGKTRNEYRLTHMTKFIRRHGLKPGDQVLLKKEDGGKRTISYRRAASSKTDDQGRLVLGTGWKVIDI